jgi:subtilisin family serine protease
VHAYNRIRYAIQDYFDEHNESDSRLIEWKEILEEVFNPANNVLYSDGKQHIVIWGCLFNNEKENYRERADIPVVLENQDNEDAEPTIEEKVEDDHARIESPESSPIVIDQKNEIIIGSNKQSSPSFFARVGYGIFHFLRTGWWFLLLLVFLWWLICHSCSAPTSRLRSDANRFLPSNPTTPVPIDTNDIGYDEDSIFQIVENRVNVAMKKDQESFLAFVTDLGEKFISGNTEIIYFDEETARIQLLFDESEHQNIKQEIRQVMSDYELLIWDEQIFSMSYAFNDPLLESEELAWHLDALKMESVWSITSGNPDVVVAVVDDGFDLTHPELNDTKKTKAYNIKTRSNRVFGTPGNSHGTHVSTLATGAANNGNGLVGIAPSTTLMPIQIGDDQNTLFSMTEVIDGILYALKNEADVINLSLGKQLSPYVATLPDSEQERLIQTIGKDEEEFWKELFAVADKQNTTIVMAAGNEGYMSGIDPMQRHENCIIVGALNKQNKLTSFSNFGRFNTVNAPGEQVVSAVPGNNYLPQDGTSMAAPIVAGAIALYKSLHPDADNSTIKNRLISTADAERGIDIVRLLKE